MEVSVDIESAGERIVEEHLRRRSFATSIDLRESGSTIIKAVGSVRKYLVEVRTAVSPDTPAPLSQLEVEKITVDAMRIGYEAWDARVRVDPSGNLLGNIIWIRLG